MMTSSLMKSPTLRVAKAGNPVMRELRLRGAVGKLRTAKFRDREHLVVPVVALVEGVMQAYNAENPEFVPAHVFQHAPAGWNGRPVVGDHPFVNGRPVSANDPAVLEAHCFGHIFNTEATTSQLEMEAWLDIILASREGTVGERVVERLRKHETVEVSIGAFVSMDGKSGTHKGIRFAQSWESLVQDHLAMLSEGDIGACSVDMGCGALRTATNVINVITPQGVQIIQEPSDMSVKPDTRSFLDRIKALVGLTALSADELSDIELRQKLDKALSATVPGYLGIDEVKPGDKTVVYAQAPGDVFNHVKRTFEVAEDGAVTFGDESTEVQPVTRYEPVAASAPSSKPAAGAPCSCQHQEGAGDMDKTQRVQALITASNGRFTDADKNWLMAIPEDRLSTLEATPASTPAQPQAPEVPTAAAPAVPAPAAPQSFEQFLSSGPAAYREQVEDGIRIGKERKAAVIKSLKDTGRCTFTDAQLETMNLNQLQQLAVLAAVPAKLEIAGVLPRVDVVEEGTIDDAPDLVAAVAARKR